MASVSAESIRQDLKDDEEEVQEISTLKFVHIIFLPFHPVFKFVILFTAILKCVMGPMFAVKNFFYCEALPHNTVYLRYMLEYYNYFGNIIYMADIFLHLLHRQIEDEARKREHTPKSAFLILMDVLSVIPFYQMTAESLCPPTRVWPNILAFSETLVIYRVVDYFSLRHTHSLFDFIVGYTITFFLVLNALTCGFLLMTIDGLCDSCGSKTKYDWRLPISFRDPAIYDSTIVAYLYGFQYVLGHVISHLTDVLIPKTIINIYATICLMYIGFTLWCLVLMPKFFNEALLRFRRLSAYNRRAKRMIQETKMRHTDPEAHKRVETFYSIIWEKQNGMTKVPNLLYEIPRYLKLAIIQDLAWAVFHHSPTFRKTSLPYKRWLCEYIRLENRLAGERLFSGLHCYTNLYYVKSGVIQFFAMDDTSAAMLSVTSGTIFGDVGAIVPPVKRKVVVRCLTYCEVFVLTRATVLTSLHKFPDDRYLILKSVNNRLRHARQLFARKQEVRGTDVVEDEGIDWLKKRWWEVSDIITAYKRTKRENKCELPPEETNYHCPKYIGQLVLCRGNQLQRASMFVRDEYPWLLSLTSTFTGVWDNVVYLTVWVTLFLLPPSLVRLVNNEPPWFTYFLKTIDFIFAVDIFVILFSSKGEHVTDTVYSTLPSRFKNLSFMLDLLATAWIDFFIKVIGLSAFGDIMKFNRLLKIHLLFQRRRPSKWNHKTVIRRKLIFRLSLMVFLLLYVSPFFTYMLISFVPGLTPEYYFYTHCFVSNRTNCIYKNKGILTLGLAFAFRMMAKGVALIGKSKLDTVLDIVVSFILYLLSIYTKSLFTSVMYLRYRPIVDYQFYVKRLRSYYKMYKIHPNLLKRLNNYFECHWKYIMGADIIAPRQLHEEPYNIYWQVHGEVAETIIKESDLFKGSELGLIRDLAAKSNYLIIPENTNLIAIGYHVNNVNWLVRGSIKCEYKNDRNQTVTMYVPKGSVLSVTSVLLGGASIRSYTTETDCELLYLTYQTLCDTLKRYPVEANYIHTCINEFRPTYVEIVEAYSSKFKPDLRKSEDVKQTEVDTSVAVKFSKLNMRPSMVANMNIKVNPFLNFFREYRKNPESRFIICWMYFRFLLALTCVVYFSLYSIVPVPFAVDKAFDAIGAVDMCIKLFLPYYDERGLIITKYWKCMLRYFTRTFLIDFLINADILPMMYEYFTKNVEKTVLVTISCTYAQIYVLIGVFNYLSDTTYKNYTLMTVIKWHLITFLTIIYICNFFMARCIDLDRDVKSSYEVEKSCWMPAYFFYEKTISYYELELMYIQAFNLAQHLLLKISSSIWIVDSSIMLYNLTFTILGAGYWFFTCLCQALIILNYRTNIVFYYNVRDLSRFLKLERVPKVLVKRAVDYFNYFWIRTKGMDIDKVMSERLGIVFRQDLCYYFNKRTLEIAMALLNAPENVQRQITGVAVDLYFDANQDIMREMDLTPNIFIVNRGKVNIFKEGRKLATLTKGSIIGQLDSPVIRPSRVTATTMERTDILMIKLSDFHLFIDIYAEIKETIAANPQSKNDYITTNKPVEEVLKDSINYILREEHTLKLPYFNKLIEPKLNKKYSYYLFFNWFILPVVTVFITMLIGVVIEVEDQRTKSSTPIPLPMLIILSILDLLYLSFIIIAIFEVKLVEHDKQLVYHYYYFRDIFMIENFCFVLDLLSLLLPIAGVVLNRRQFHYARMYRLNWITEVERYFCRSMEKTYLPKIVKSVLIVLLLHVLACGWVDHVCKGEPYYKNLPMPPRLLLNYDPKWYITDGSKRYGCSRSTVPYLDENNRTNIGFVYVKKWTADYTLALYLVTCSITMVNSDGVLPTTMIGVLYKVILTLISHAVNMYLCSVAISSFYTKHREKHKHDYEEENLLIYLKKNGLSKILLGATEKILGQIWRKQQDCTLPHIAESAPLCLREDLMESLYMHHLLAPPLLNKLPNYFLRQLATRLERVVIFPGKNIVEEGDVYPCMFFVHEGEVERWHIDEKTGDSRMTTLLCKNDYFGLIPGLFPNTPYQFSYYSRTVVDLVFLNFDAWQDLLNGYINIKYQLYKEAIELTK